MIDNKINCIGFVRYKGFPGTPESLPSSEASSARFCIAVDLYTFKKETVSTDVSRDMVDIQM
jgi:hypothetical protein